MIIYIVILRAQRRPNIYLTCIASIGAKLVKRSDKQVSWQ